MDNYTVQSVKPQQRSRLYWLLSDSAVLIKRSALHIIKNYDQLLSVAFQPIMFLLLFRYVFGGSIDVGGVSYADFLLAGVLVQMAAFGSTYTALGVAMDLRRGIIDRFKSLPMFSGAVLIGHTVADLVRNMLSAIIMVVVGLAVGFRPTADAGEWLMALGILLLFTFALSWLSAILGLLSRSAEAVQWISFVVVFPLTFASSAFVRPEDMPLVLRVFAENQPVTHTIEAIRALLLGTPIENHGWLAVVWSVGILAVAIPVASYIFRRTATK